MPPLVQDAVKEIDRTGRSPETVLADAGYCNERGSRPSWRRSGHGRLRGAWAGRASATAGGGRGEAHPAKASHGGETVDARGTGGDTRNANGCRRRRSDGSRRRWVSGGSACAAWRKVRGEWDLVCLALNVKRLQPLMAA